MYESPASLDITGLAGLFLFLWGGILLGTGMFFSGRERIYKKAVSVVERFMEAQRK